MLNIKLKHHSFVVENDEIRSKRHSFKISLLDKNNVPLVVDKRVKSGKFFVNFEALMFIQGFT